MHFTWGVSGKLSAIPAKFKSQNKELKSVQCSLGTRTPCICTPAYIFSKYFDTDIFQRQTCQSDYLWSPSYINHVIVLKLCCVCLSASSGELKFEPGQSEATIAINILDDSIPEEDESFRVRLKNPKGGAEIGVHSYVTVIIPSNDYAHGIIGFSQVMIIIVFCNDFINISLF